MSLRSFVRRSRRHALVGTGVRAQATLAATAVVALAMLLGGAAIVTLLHNSLSSTLTDSVVALVDEDAATLRASGIEALRTSEADRGADSVLVQVVDDTGQVVYTSEVGRPIPVSTERPSPGERRVVGRSFVPWPGTLDDRLVVAQGVDVAGADWVVLASTSQASQDEAVTTTAWILLGGVPLLVALAGGVTWWRVGRALGSVERIRTRVERIGATTALTERVPVPPSHDEIAHLATTMNAMLHRLEASQAAQAQFVADASHELRSPLATLTASVEVAESDPTGVTWRELAPVLHDETERMTRLVNDLLVLSRPGQDAAARPPGDVDLDDLADREVRRARHVSDVVVDLTAVAVRVRGDDHQLTQVLRNVLDNAVRHARGRVAVTVTGHSGLAIVVVSDDGPGIPEADRERVFDRFVRLDESRSRGSGGSGLGLAIARRLVSAHGGSIEVAGSSTLGGAEVTIVLPVAEPG